MQAPFLVDLSQSSLSRFLSYRDWLAFLFAEAKKKNNKYSYKLFSEDLGFSSPHISYILTMGIRKMSPQYATVLCKGLHLKGWERKYFLQMVEFTDASKDQDKQNALNAMIDLRESNSAEVDDRLSFRFFRDWYHAAIFELVVLPHFNPDPEHIAVCFFKRVSSEQVRESLQLLQDMGLIERDGESYKKSQKSLHIAPEISGLAVAGYHYQMIDLAKGSMSQTPAEQREINSLTLSVSDEILQRLRKDIQLFKKYVIFLSEQCENPSQVVQMNLQLFPLTRPFTSPEENQHASLKPHFS